MWESGMSFLLPGIWKSSRAVLLAAAMLVNVQSAMANESVGFPANIMQPIGLSGSLRFSEFYRDRSFSTETGILNASVWANLRPESILGIQPVVDFRVQAQNLPVASLGSQSQGGAAASVADVDVELREAFVEASLGSFDFRMGRQILVWGRADKVNPTDNLTVRDFGLLVTDDEDQRLGPFTTQAVWNTGDYRLYALWQPEWREPVFPLGALGSGIQIAYGKPANTFEQFAVKLDRSGGAVDWSVSYFHGIDKTPDIRLVSSTASSTQLELLFQKIDVIGADFATTFGQTGVRGEAAYTRTRDTTGGDIFTKNANLFVVLGIERSFYETMNLNLQYLYRHTFGFVGANTGNAGLDLLALQVNINAQQLAQNMHGASLRLSHKALNDTLESEVALVTWFSTSDYLLRPKVTYAFSDSLRGTMGAEFFQGSSSTFFGRLQAVSNGFAEVRYLF
jgi:hypothetical protein